MVLIEEIYKPEDMINLTGDDFLSFDYRKDIIKLMNATNDTEESLNQSMIALELITKIYNNSFVDSKTIEKKEIEKQKPKINNSVSSSQQTKDISKPDSQSESSDTTNKSANTLESNSAASNNKSELKPAVLKNKQKFTAKNLPPLPTVKKVNPLPNISNKYRITRKLSGSEAVDDQGNQIQYFTESVTRSMKLEENDIVTLSNNTNANEMRFITNVEHSSIDTNKNTREIAEFGPALIKDHSLGLYIQKNLNGDELSKFNPEKARFYFDLTAINTFNLKPNDLVSVAWYKDEPKFIRVRWKYKSIDTDLTKEKTVSDNKKSKGKVKSLLHQKSKKQDSSSNKNTYTPRIDFDLDKKKVTIIVGDKSLTSNLGQVVTAHNGTLKISELTQPANALRTAKESDYVILIQSYIKHGMSQLLINNPNKTYSIAMATNAGQLDIEKALFRAKNKLNVVDNDQISYPMIN